MTISESFQNRFFRVLRRYRIRIAAIAIISIGLFTNIGTRLGIWSTPKKSGLLPYEAPTFHGLFTEDAEAQPVFDDDPFAT